MKLFIIGSVVAESTQQEEFRNFCQEIGRQLAAHPVTLLLCSPHQGSCDVEIIKGLRSAPVINQRLSIELHYPATPENKRKWTTQLKGIPSTVMVRKFDHQIPITNDQDANSYAWLFCQLQAVSISNIVMSIGGRLSGSSNLLLRIAEAQEKEIIPLVSFGGVGELFYNRLRYKLQDTWGEKVTLFEHLGTALKIIELIITKPKDPVITQLTGKREPSFFISYPKKRPADADFVEMILRRRNYQVYRDETDIAPGHDIPSAISENIYKSDIFIVLWCAEYACSPWCYDELNQAIKSHDKKSGKSLWIFALDDTRMIHPKARKLLLYNINNRLELEGQISSLLKPA